VTSRADGSVRVIGHIDVLVWYGADDPADLGPGVWLIDHGRVIEYFDADGNLTNSDYQEGAIIDVCAELT
jgi:hypothetical protein